ncbi:MAG: DUF465 domain-containing protein [Pseudomonadota bacterium]
MSDLPPDDGLSPAGAAGVNDEALRLELLRLRQEHGDLDAAIYAMEERAGPDLLAIQRMKKRKLQLKDRILKVEDALNPDIIA